MTDQKTKPQKDLEARLARLTEQSAELERSNYQLKEQLVDAMRGEIEARRKLEAIRDHISVGQMRQDASTEASALPERE